MAMHKTRRRRKIDTTPALRFTVADYYRHLLSTPGSLTSPTYEDYLGFCDTATL